MIQDDVLRSELRSRDLHVYVYICGLLCWEKFYFPEGSPLLLLGDINMEGWGGVTEKANSALRCLNIQHLQAFTVLRFYPNSLFYSTSTL